MFIYMRRNKINNKMYIGQTINSLDKRWRQEFREKSLLGRALRKHGPENFDNFVLEECEDIDTLNFREQCYIAQFGTIAPHGYNLTCGGRNGKKSIFTRNKMKNNKNALGLKHSETTKRHLSKVLSGRKFSQLHKDRMNTNRVGFKGKKQTEKQKSAMSKAVSGILNCNAKLNWEIVDEIRIKFSQGQSLSALGREYNVYPSTIQSIVNRETWIIRG